MARRCADWRPSCQEGPGCLAEAAGTAATTRVLVESGKGSRRWATVGCSSNIIEASLEALLDSLEYARLT